MDAIKAECLLEPVTIIKERVEVNKLTSMKPGCFTQPLVEGDDMAIDGLGLRIIDHRQEGEDDEFLIGTYTLEYPDVMTLNGSHGCIHQNVIDPDHQDDGPGVPCERKTAQHTVGGITIDTHIGRVDTLKGVAVGEGVSDEDDGFDMHLGDLGKLLLVESPVKGGICLKSYGNEQTKGEEL